MRLRINMFILWATTSVLLGSVALWAQNQPADAGAKEAAVTQAPMDTGMVDKAAAGAVETPKAAKAQEAAAPAKPAGPESKVLVDVAGGETSSAVKAEAKAPDAAAPVIEELQAPKAEAAKAEPEKKVEKAAAAEERAASAEVKAASAEKAVSAEKDAASAEKKAATAEKKAALAEEKAVSAEEKAASAEAKAAESAPVAVAPVIEELNAPKAEATAPAAEPAKPEPEKKAEKAAPAEVKAAEPVAVPEESAQPKVVVEQPVAPTEIKPETTPPVILKPAGAVPEASPKESPAVEQVKEVGGKPAEVPAVQAKEVTPKPEAAAVATPAAKEPAAKPAAVAPAPIPVPATAEERMKAAEGIAASEEVRRQAREVEGKKDLDKADAAFRNRDFVNAKTSYENALSKMAVVPVNAVGRSRAISRLPECEYEIALNLLRTGKKDEAKDAAAKASAKYPSHAGLKKLVDRIGADMEADKAAAAVAATDAAKAQRDAATRKTEVQKQFSAGKRSMAERDYDKAKASFESVLALEPENREAMRYLKELADRKYATSEIERKATAGDMTAKVRAAWNPPQYKKTAPEAVKPQVVSGVSPLQKKMEAIIIPEIEFRQMNIHDVVQFLNKASRDEDKAETDDMKKGVNIILNLNPAGTRGAAQPAAGGAADVFGAEQPAGAAAAGAGGVNYEITFTARYISLLQALKLVTQVSGLKYRVEGNVVMIVPPDYDPGEIVTRMYSVEPTFIERVKEVGGAAAPTKTETRGGKEVTLMSGNENQMETGLPDLKKYFADMGVKFPSGASITYSASIGKVIVANTSENLAKFEELLASLNVVPKQVEIEARFVEVNETDLQELGLEWLLTDNWEMATKKGAAPLGGKERIQMNANSAAGGFTSGLRFLGQDTAGDLNAIGGGKGALGNLVSISSVLTNPELTFILHALQQNGNADLLSAPKVTTQSGQEASIRVVTEFIYPTEFNVQGGQIQSSASGVGGNIVQETVVTPQSFQTREVGVILTVLPEVSPDGNTINLTMSPEVVTDPTWQQYGSSIRRVDGSVQQLNMPMPFFHTRKVTTKISIYDGATVVMGGLITESLQKTNDKIPVLGDIPILGILFRSQTEQSAKKNLLIFVTAKLVDPAGRLIRQTAAETAKTASTP